MNTRQSVLLIFLTGIAVGSIIGFGSPVHSQEGAIPGAEGAVTQLSPVITLGKLVRALSEQSAVPLRVAPELQGQTVLLVVRNRPLREVMDNLAAALGYAWDTDRSGSQQLVEPPSARTARLALEERILAEVSREFTQHLQTVARYLEQFRELPAEAGRAAAVRLEQQAGALPAGPERERLTAEARAAAQAADPNQRPLVELAGSLTPEERRRLLAGERLVYSQQIPGTRRIPPAVVQALAARFPAGIAGRPTLPALDMCGAYTWEGFSLTVRAATLTGEPALPPLRLPPQLDTAAGLRLGRALVENFPGRVSADMPDLVSQHVRFHRGANMPDLHRTWWPTVLGVLLPNTVDITARASPEWAFVGDAAVRGCIADQPGRGRLVAEQQLRQATPPTERDRDPVWARVRPVSHMATVVAQHLGTHVHVARGKWMRFRSPLYPLDLHTPIEPDSFRTVFRSMELGPASPSASRAPTLSPATAQRAAQTLTPRQLAVLLHPDVTFGPGPWYLTWISDGWAGWRLLGALSRSAAADLGAGRPLVAERLSVEDRRALMLFVREASDMPQNPPLDLLLLPQDLRRVRLSLGPPTREADRYAGQTRRLEVRFGNAPQSLCTLSLRAQWEESPPHPTP